MAEGSQYFARHTESGVEVEITYRRRLDSGEIAALEKLGKGLARFLGELETADSEDRKTLMDRFGHLFTHVGDMKEMLSKFVGFSLIWTVMKRGKGIKPKFEHRFSEN